jgi:hypothetical protein
MPGIKLQKRGYDFFVSYGHADLGRVDEVVRYLTKPCGLSLWFDAESGNAAQRSSELLAGAVGNSRGAVFFLSSSWKQSSWCKNEYEVALTEQRAQDGFEVVAVRIDDTEPPPWFNVSEVIDLRVSDTNSVARLLRSLSADVPHRFDNAQDVYLSAPWSRQTDSTSRALQALASAGWRLVGDSPTLSYLGSSRIEAIMRTTRGVVAIVPWHPSEEPIGASRFIVAEIEIALKSGRPVMLIVEPRVKLPPELIEASFRGAAVPLTAAAEDYDLLVEALEAFDDELATVDHSDSGAYIFFAASLRDDASIATDLANVIERASNMRCVRGERMSGSNVQEAIIDYIRRAAVVIADVTDDHKNTLIEAGIALGSGTPIKLIVHAPDGFYPKKRFMFEGQEVYGYSSPEERLGLCYWIARQFRRRIYVTP